MTSLFRSFGYGLVLMAAACSHYSEDMASLEGKVMKAGDPSMAVAAAPAPQDIAPAAGGGVDSKMLGQYLARDYYDLAKYENDKAYDYKAAKTYTEKAMKASKGEVTAPSRIAAYDVPPESIPALNEAREGLIAALRNPNMGGHEQQLAKAQVSFDCWLERAEEASDETHYASCRDGFESAMAQMITPAAGAATVSGMQMAEVSFADGADTIDAVSASMIDQVASFVMSPEGAGYEVVVTGFTPMQDITEKSRFLATSRALKVREALIAKGVNTAAIKPQIAPVPQVTDIVPVAGGAITADQGGLERKVQIHLVPVAAPVVSAPETIAQ